MTHPDSTRTPEYLSFDRVAAIYESTRHIPDDILNEAARMLVRDSLIRTGEPFLDAGVGTGRFGRRLRQAGIRTVGVDISVDMLHEARERCPDLGLVRADLRRLPLQHGTFGGALIVHVLHLISDWRRVVSEVRLTLKPGARLYIGSESGKWFKTRGIYFQVAGERGLTRPNLGAESFDAILGHLSGTGARIHRIDGGRLTWTARERVGDLLELQQMNVFTPLWHLSPEEHAGLFEEARARVLSEFASLDEFEAAPVELSLWRVTWPNGVGG